MKEKIKRSLFFIVGVLSIVCFAFAFFEPVGMKDSFSNTLKFFEVALGRDDFKGTPLPFLGYVLTLFSGILAIVLCFTYKYLNKNMYRNLGIVTVILSFAGVCMIGCTQYFIIHANPHIPLENFKDMALTIYTICGIVFSSLACITSFAVTIIPDERNI